MLAVDCRSEEARQVYTELEARGTAQVDYRLRVLVRNDLAVLAVMEGHFDEDRQGWLMTLGGDWGCLVGRLKRDLVIREFDRVNEALID